MPFQQAPPVALGLNKGTPDRWDHMHKLPEQAHVLRSKARAALVSTGTLAI
jgi:hypothetical protein